MHTLGRMTSRKAVAAFKATCQVDLPTATLVPVLLEALHDVVPSARNLFDWTDDDGRLLHYFIEGPVDEAVAQHYFEVFHNRLEAQAMPAFGSLRTAPGGIRSAADLDHGRFFESALYHEIWKPQGFRYRVEAVVRGSRGQLLGSLVLYRGPGDRCFTAREEQTLQELLPHIAEAIERGRFVPEGQRHVPRPRASQLLLIDLRGRVCHASPGARRLLMLARGGMTRERLDMPLDLLAGPLLDLLLRQMRLHERPAGPHLVTQDNAWGAFTFAATPLVPVAGAEPLVQVMIHWSEPHQAALHRALRRLPITAGQAVVCRALYDGQAQTQISQQLGVSPTTVIDHVRKVYRALDVRSALELRARIEQAMHDD